MWQPTSSLVLTVAGATTSVCCHRRSNLLSSTRSQNVCVVVPLLPTSSELFVRLDLGVEVVGSALTARCDRSPTAGWTMRTTGTRCRARRTRHVAYRSYVCGGLTPSAAVSQPIAAGGGRAKRVRRRSWT